MRKVSVLTITWKPWDFLLKQAACLKEQTLPYDDWEWVVVDDCHQHRPTILTGLNLPFRVLHIPPHELLSTSEPLAAINTALLYAEGELIHFMGDYMILGTSVLKTHWSLFETYGPKVIISGPVTALHTWRPAEERVPEVFIGPREDGIGWVESIDHIRRWYWATKNDSAGLEATLDINGFDERLDAHTGGGDVEFAMRMISNGCKYLAETKTQSWEHDHQGKKREWPRPVSWQDLFAKAQRGEALWAPNGRNLRAERERLCEQSRSTTATSHPRQRNLSPKP